MNRFYCAQSRYNNANAHSPEIELASAILKTAKSDLEAVRKHGDKTLDQYPVSKNELIAFFRSEWCRFLMESFRLDYKEILKELAV